VVVGSPGNLNRVTGEKKRGDGPMGGVIWGEKLSVNAREGKKKHLVSEVLRAPEQQKSRIQFRIQKNLVGIRAEVGGKHLSPRQPEVKSCRNNREGKDRFFRETAY